MDIKKLYLDGYGTTEISELSGFHRSTIQRKLKKHGVTLRKRTPTSKYNIKYFSKLNEYSCYWAGFIAADGCIRKDRSTLSIHIGKKDINHLEKFKQSIELSSNIEVFDNSCRITVSGQWFVNDLNNKFNIGPQKSLTYCPPNLPPQMMKHFIRGYFDGDGCITKTSIPSVSIIGTEKTCNVLNDYAIDCGIKLKSKNEVAPLIKAGQAYQISYSGKNAYLMLNNFYSGSNIFLDRKKESFNRLFEKYKQ